MTKLEFGNQTHINQRKIFEREQYEKESLKLFKVTRDRTVTISEEVEIRAVDEQEAADIAKEDDLDWDETDSECDDVMIIDVTEIHDDVCREDVKELAKQLTF